MLATSHDRYSAAAADHRPNLLANADSPEERQARSVAQRAAAIDEDGAPLTAPTAHRDVVALSGPGRRYFTPLVGAAAVSRARIHVGGPADRVAGLAMSAAVTHGDDIFVPGLRFRPQTPGGRALLAHELAHVAHRPPGAGRVFRQARVEPHYPTEQEQRDIEKAMSREFEKPAAQPQPATAGGRPPPAVVRGRSLTHQERQALARDLEDPFEAALGDLDQESGNTGGIPASPAEAFESVTSAREEVYRRYGAHARQLSLTREETETPERRRAAGKVLVLFGSSATIVFSFARTIIETHCGRCLAALAGLDDVSRTAVVDILTANELRSQGERLRRVAAMRVGGSHSTPQARITIGLANRAELFGSAVHEFIHALAHPAFEAAFIDERSVIEGFTEYFTRQVVSGRSSYEDALGVARSAHAAMSGPFTPSLFGAAAEESMRLAYFRGRLELIGWRPSGPAEQEAVEAAGGSAQWDPEVARQREPAYRARIQAAQGASSNILGVGLFFSRQSGSDPTITVRYARLIASTEPYARGRLLAEGQLVGTPMGGAKALGGSLGVSAEYQEPWFYVSGGLRFVGTRLVTSGENRLDVSPFAGGGVRLWQVVRVGGEGVVLLPVTGQKLQYGGGVTIGIEFD